MRALFVVALLLVATTAQAKPWYKDKKFWLGEGAITVTIGLDAGSTRYGLDRGGAETNPLLGPHPSNGALMGAGLGLWGIETTLHYFAHRVTRNDPSRAWRAAGYLTVPVVTGAFTLPHAINNFETK